MECSLSPSPRDISFEQWKLLLNVYWNGYHLNVNALCLQNANKAFECRNWCVAFHFLWPGVIVQEWTSESSCFIEKEKKRLEDYQIILDINFSWNLDVVLLNRTLLCMPLLKKNKKISLTCCCFLRLEMIVSKIVYKLYQGFNVTWWNPLGKTIGRSFIAFSYFIFWANDLWQ